MVDQIIFAGIGQTVDNVLKVFIPAMLARVNPDAQAGQAIEMFKDAKKHDRSPADVGAKDPFP